MKKKMLLALLLVIVLCVGLMFSAGADAAGEIRIAGHTLALEDSVQVVYYVDESKVPEGATTGLLVWKTAPAADGYTYANAQYKLTSTEKNSDGYKVFRFQKLAAKEMTMDLYAVAYYCKDGAYTYSAPDKYGVLQYAYNQAKTAAWNQSTGGGSITLGEMVAELLDYGFTAQKYFYGESNITRPADATYYQVTVEGGTLADGFTKGLFHAGETVNVVAAEEGVDHWYAGEEYLGQVSSFTMPAKDVTVTAKDSGPVTANWKIGDTGYETLAAALAAAEPSCEIVLQNDVGEGNTLVTCSQTTIDLNGKNYSSTIYVNADGITVKNGSISGVDVYGGNMDTVIEDVSISDLLTAGGEVTANRCAMGTLEIPDGGSFTGVNSNIFAFVSIEGSGSLTLDGTSTIGDLKLYEDFYGAIVWDCGEPTIEVDGYEWVYYDEGWKLEKPQVKALEYEFNGESYTVIGIGDFDGESEITIPNYYDGEDGEWPVTGIGYDAFGGNTDLTSVEIGGNVTYIGASAFSGCENLSYVWLQDGLERIGECAFEYTGLSSIEIPDSVETIESCAFSDCSSLESVELGDGLKQIGDRAFGTTSIFVIEFPDSLEYIGEAAFGSCEYLQSVTIPGVVEISSGAFQYCTSLTDVSLPDEMTSIPNWAFHDTGISSLEFLPEGVTTIGWYAFADCAFEGELEIPDGIKEIQSHAFYNNNITTLTLPSTLESVGDYAFAVDGGAFCDTIIFNGERAQWENVVKGNGWGFVTVQCLDD